MAGSGQEQSFAKLTKNMNFSEFAYRRLNGQLHTHDYIDWAERLLMAGSDVPRPIPLDHFDPTISSRVFIGIYKFPFAPEVLLLRKINEL